MKFTKTIFIFTAFLLAVLFIDNTAVAQQYKLRQVTNMSSMKSESTIYVKGMRKRTEGGGFAGMSNPTTIEQCDLQRTIKINDKKKLYYIEPFSKEAEEVIDEDAKPAAVKSKPAPQTKEKDKTGGTITMWYNITDTGERKKMYGFTARHVWTTQKMKPSADACTMKDSMIIKTDGWYIDLPQFNCPVRYTPNNFKRPATANQPECKDRFVSRRSGKGKLGFPLIETKTIIMGGAAAQTSNFETTIETLEFSTAKLDSMLFEIPLGYTETKNEEDLQDKFDVASMLKQQGYDKLDRAVAKTDPNEPKKAGAIRIAVYEPTSEEQLQASVLQQHLVSILTSDKVEAVAVASEEEAKKYKCDLSLTTEFTKVKQASKVGGLIKAIKNADPNAANSFNIDANLTLSNLSDGSTKAKEQVSGKYDGKADEAAMKALDKAGSKMLSKLK
jgi:hypothetical protein